MAAGNWQLETRRLILRRVTLDDADLMFAVWNDPAFVRHVGDRSIRTIDEAREAVRVGPLKLYEDYGFGPCAMVLKTNGTRIGICGLFQRENLDFPDIGFAVLPDYCGQGYAREAALAVLAHARDDLALRRISAIVAPGNAPSIGLLERIGLEYEGMITMPDETEAICLYGMRMDRE